RVGSPDRGIGWILPEGILGSEFTGPASRAEIDALGGGGDGPGIVDVAIGHGPSRRRAAQASRRLEGRPVPGLANDPDRPRDGGRDRRAQLPRAVPAPI